MWLNHCRGMDEAQAEQWRAAFAVKRRRPFWQELLVVTFKMARGER